ncbi:MAG TPA: alpha/beta hydrolase [Kofleriaceae bacterium]|nr:alpha/beta hydrolase [Kofleriaceae bacterium]
MHTRAALTAAAAVALALAGCPSFHAGPLAGAPAGDTFVDVDGVHVHYRDVGHGPPVVLVHGYGASIELWRGVQDALAAHHRVIALDLKGFGWTSRPPGDYTPPAEATLVWHLLDQLGVGDVAIVGHSWGASVSLAMALEHPQRVRRIALYSAYVYEAQVPSFFRWARVGGLGEALFALYYRERVEDRAALAYHDARFVTQARVDRIEAELHRPGAVAAALAAARGQRYAAVEQRYGEIAQPTLLLWGDDDLVTPVRFGRRLARQLPDAELKVFPDCGHIPMVEAAGETTRALAAFLDADANDDAAAGGSP